MKSVSYRFSGPRETHLRNHLLLAPAGWNQIHCFHRAIVDPLGHDNLIDAIQRFRGNSYLADGAIQERHLTPDGRHQQNMDRDSWHLVVLDDDGDIVSCARYHPIKHPRFEETVASKSALAKSPEWRKKVRQVVENSFLRAGERGAQFAELGGWCVATEARNTAHALRSVLHMFALGEILGGTIGLSTATTRHSSSSILQRLGARKVELNGEVLPSYFDPTFDCEMELLQFDSLQPAAKYSQQVAEYQSVMKAEMRVICQAPPAPTCISSLTNLLNALTPAVPVPVHSLLPMET